MSARGSGAQSSAPLDSVRKAPTGIAGFDELTDGGLPAGRPCLIVGGPGTGKTLFGIEFLVNGATKFGEPGVFVSFEESEKELIQNSASLHFNLRDLMDRKKLALDYVVLEPNRIIETGEYDLEGLFVRINNAIETVKAKRIVLDTLEAVFSTFGNAGIVRSEMVRLFRFLKDKGVTAVITAEAGENTLSRHGLEEYISDMVISLDHRVIEERATRRMRIVKYRGSAHGTNEYPFLIESHGLSVVPITSVNLVAKVSKRRVSSGIPDLDGMLGGKGYYEGSTILITGAAGTGKTSFAAEFARNCCREGKKVLFLAFEESSDQLVRNMKSIGINLDQYVSSGKLVVSPERPSSVGLEMHLARLHSMVDKIQPDAVIIDPISSLAMIGNKAEVKSVLLRVTDFLKMLGVTVMLTELRDDISRGSGAMMSSLADTWILLEDIESNGEKNRLLRVIKSRGMAHSNQLREISITSRGIRIVPPHIGDAGVLTGTARYIQERKDAAEKISRMEEVERLKRDVKLLRHRMNLQIQSMKMEMTEKEAALKRRLEDETRMGTEASGTRAAVTRIREGRRLNAKKQS